LSLELNITADDVVGIKGMFLMMVQGQLVSDIAIMVSLLRLKLIRK
jgi:hypothetical protein